MSLFKMLLPTALLVLAQSAAALQMEKVNHAEVTLDLDQRVQVPVAGGVKLGRTLCPSYFLKQTLRA